MCRRLAVVDNDGDDNDDDDTSSTTSDEGDNRRGRQRRMRIDGNNVCALATAMTQPVVRQRHVDRRMEAPADESSSSSDAFSFPPLRDGSAPYKIPSNGGGSDISRVVREFFIGKIRVSAVIVVDPLASPLPSPLSDMWRALLVAAAAAPAATVPFDGSFGDKREANGRRREWWGGE